MSHISSDELRKIAHMSLIYISDKELPAMMKQVEAVLAYAHRVAQATGATEHVTRMTNILRQDIVVVPDAHAILQEAPQSEGNYFVVPAIL